MSSLVTASLFRIGLRNDRVKKLFQYFGSLGLLQLTLLTTPTSATPPSTSPSSPSPPSPDPLTQD
ncbi:hypothetical protein, partial [Leptodesmis sp.]|uniref:hypothetical protein n=1 Tax=Leptodesmis sp. TaxID=3100501 RepID=UPI0040535797